MICFPAEKGRWWKRQDIRQCLAALWVVCVPLQHHLPLGGAGWGLPCIRTHPSVLRCAALSFVWDGLWAQLVKKLPANAEDEGPILGSGSSPREGNGNLLQYSCLENPMVRGAWWAMVHGVTV